MRSARTTLALALTVTAGALALAPAARADHGGLTVTGLTQSARLVTFTASAPGTLLSSVKVTGPTGVEMEALTAVSVACLTIYDMIKAVERGVHIEGIRLLEKSGGKSGHYKHEK